MFGKRKIYMDHAATTPVDKRVVNVMKPYYINEFYNAGGIYTGAVSAKKSIEDSRAKIADLIHARPQEIIFTEGATEANNLIILGLVEAWHSDGHNGKPHIITTEIEHPSVLETCKYLEKSGKAEVDYASVDEDGIVDPNEIKKVIKDNTLLVSVMYANNEIGTIQSIREIAKGIRFWRKNNNTEYPYFHSDAVQAVNYLDLQVDRLGVDMMTMNASKIYGPKMIGAFYKKENVSVSPILHGGSQEFKLRPGTENVAGCVGFAMAMEIAREMWDRETERLSGLQTYFFEQLQDKIPDSYINGSVDNRLPNNVNISIPGISGEELILRLDAAGIQASTQSACKADNSQQSHIIKALYKKSVISSEVERSRDSSATLGMTNENDAVLRFTMGRETKKSDIDNVVTQLKRILDKYKK